MHEEIYVYLHPLPDGVKECVCPCNGGYNVTIDPRLSREGIIKAYRHALEHIKNNDFEKWDVNIIERSRHGKG